MNDGQTEREADRRIALLDLERHESGERVMTPEQLAQARKAAGVKPRRWEWEMQDEEDDNA